MWSKYFFLSSFFVFESSQLNWFPLSRLPSRCSTLLSPIFRVFAAISRFSFYATVFRLASQLFFYRSHPCRFYSVSPFAFGGCSLLLFFFSLLCHCFIQCILVRVSIVRSYAFLVIDPATFFQLGLTCVRLTGAFRLFSLHNPHNILNFVSLLNRFYGFLPFPTCLFLFFSVRSAHSGLPLVQR